MLPTMVVSIFLIILLLACYFVQTVVLPKYCKGVHVTGSDPERPWRHADACVIVRFRLTPKSSKDTIDGRRRPPRARPSRRACAPFPKMAQPMRRSSVSPPRGSMCPAAVRLIAGAKSRVKSLAIYGETHAIEGRLTERFAALRA